MGLEGFVDKQTEQQVCVALILITRVFRPPTTLRQPVDNSEATSFLQLS